MKSTSRKSISDSGERPADAANTEYRGRFSSSNSHACSTKRITSIRCCGTYGVISELRIHSSGEIDKYPSRAARRGESAVRRSRALRLAVCAEAETQRPAALRDGHPPEAAGDGSVETRLQRRRFREDREDPRSAEPSARETESGSAALLRQSRRRARWAHRRKLGLQLLGAA